MSIGPRYAGGLITAALCSFSVAFGTAAGPDADSLARLAAARLDVDTPDSRRHALADLEQATRLAPERGDLWLACGRLQLRMGESSSARASFSKAADRSPHDPEAALALGVAYKWDWLEALDPDSFRRSAEALARATAAAPDRPGAWIELTALALVQGDARLAADAAVHAHDADPDGAAPVLALACVAYRLGRVHLADSLFEQARRRLEPALARRFEDLKLVTGRGSGSDSAAAAADEARRFWGDHDPDLTTPENEARLGFLSRLGHAMLLFRDGDRVRWDLRTELVVRYGLPARIEFNRPDAGLQSKGLQRIPDSGSEQVLFGYAFNEQVWTYPALGLRVPIWDQHLSGNYGLPVAAWRDPDPRPDPKILAARTDLVVLGDGRGVYRALPPGAHPLAAVAHLARFPSGRGRRVMAHLVTPGSPSDTLRGSWVVLDPGRREVARSASPLTVSACDPTGARAVEFSADLEPGDYRVGFAVEDPHGGRGLATLPLHVAAPQSGLALSDLTLVCGDAATAVAEQSVRIEPEMESRVRAGRPAAVYFEIAGLTCVAGQLARFAIAYRVRSLEPRPDQRPWPPVIDATREESQPGSLRRQFLRVPTEKLAAGEYELEIEVRDLATGARAPASVRFEIERESAPAASR